MATILVADDAQLNIDRMVAVITDAGHECVQATDGLEAVQYYSKHRPAAVFLDMSMPMMDGLVALHAILEADPQARVRIVTGLATYDVVSQAKSQGAVDFIVKPFPNDRLLTALKRMLA